MTLLRQGCVLGALTLLLAFAPLHGQAQDAIAFDHFTVADGLSHNTVFTGLQDRQGFLWFGTVDGLNRCDGYGCMVFAHDPRDTTSLSNSWVWTLYEDRAGVMWVGTWGGGLNRFNRETETFTRYQHDPSDPQSLSDNVIRTIVEDAAGDLWVGTNEGGLNRLDRKTHRFTRYQHDPNQPQGLRSNSIQALVVDLDGVLWVGTQIGGLHRFDSSTQSFVAYPQRRNSTNDIVSPKGLKSRNVNALHQNRADELWVGTWSGGVHRMDKEAEVFHPVATDALGLAIVRAIHQDQRGALWVGTFADGLFRIDLTTGTTTNYRHETDNPQSLSDNSVTAIFEDHTGILWITTRGGIDRLNVHHPTKTRYIRTPGHPNSLRDNHIFALMQSQDDGLWVGTKTGLDHLDLATSTVTPYHYDPNLPRFEANRPIRSFWPADDGNVWVGTDGNGLGLLTPSTGIFTYHLAQRPTPQKISNNGVFALIQAHDNPDDLWIGTWFGLNRMDLGTRRFQQYLPEKTGFSDGSILALYEAPSEPGTFWLGTNDGGINRFDLNTEAVTVYRHDPSDTTSLSSNHVLAFYEDPEGQLWIGTGGGLNQMVDREHGRFRVFTTADGLPNNTVSCIVPDDHGHLWLGTNQGLARFAPQAETFEHFDAGDGFQQGVFERNACTRLPDGRLAFGGENGLNIFHPDSLDNNPHPPRVAITAFHLFGQPTRVNDKGRIATSQANALVVDGSQAITLRHDENVFAFTFAGLHFVNPSGNRYTYQLEGFRNEWVDIGNQRTASFTGLPPGAYTFRVKAANSDGVWNETGATVPVRILPPWWQTTWAYTLYGLLTLGLIMGIAQWRSLRLRRRNQELSRLVQKRTAEVEAQKVKLQAQADKLLELDRAKSRFFANLSHEFRTPLTLIQSPIESALRGDYGPLDALLHDHLQITGRNTERLRRLIDQLLDLTKLEAGAMTLTVSRQDVVSFLRRVLASFASLSQRAMIRLELESEHDTLDLSFDADKLEQVIVNLVANAFKYTEAGGRITVHVQASSDGVALIAVEDTGMGIPREALPHLFDRFYQVEGSAPSYEGTGIGLALVKELVELHDGTISVESRLGQGTRFVITLPWEEKGRTIGEENRRKEARMPPPPSAGAPLDTPQHSAPADAPAAAPLNNLGVPKLLIVEDNADLRAYVRDHLSGDYQVIEAVDGAEGFRRACEQEPDVIISDVMMPVMDGLALLGRLKQHETLQAVPVILLTARAEARDRLAGFEAQADAYLAKPFSLSELKTRIATLLNARERLQNVYSQQIVHLTPEAPQVPTDEARFLTQVEAVVSARLGEGDFGVDALAEAVFVSRSQLYRRLEALTGESPAALIRRMRLERAQQMLEAKVHTTVTEVAAAVGFNNVSHFSRLYRKHFGQSPAEVLSARA